MPDHLASGLVLLGIMVVIAIVVAILYRVVRRVSADDDPYR